MINGAGHEAARAVRPRGLRESSFREHGGEGVGEGGRGLDGGEGDFPDPVLGRDAEDAADLCVGVVGVGGWWRLGVGG